MGILGSEIPGTHEFFTEWLVFAKSASKSTHKLWHGPFLHPVYSSWHHCLIPQRCSGNWSGDTLYCTSWFFLVSLLCALIFWITFFFLGCIVLLLATKFPLHTNLMINCEIRSGKMVLVRDFSLNKVLQTGAVAWNNLTYTLLDVLNYCYLKVILYRIAILKIISNMNFICWHWHFIFFGY